MIAIVSYNSLPKLREILDTQRYYVADKIFNPKSPDSVQLDDLDFQKLLTLRKEITTVYVFVGKKSSGACEMIHLFCKFFSTTQLFFVSCDHDLKEKEELFLLHGIMPSRYTVFRDNSAILNRRCNEEVILTGLALCY